MQMGLAGRAELPRRSRRRDFSDWLLLFWNPKRFSLFDCMYKSMHCQGRFPMLSKLHVKRYQEFSICFASFLIGSHRLNGDLSHRLQDGVHRVCLDIVDVSLPFSDNRAETDRAGFRPGRADCWFDLFLGFQKY